MEALAARNDGPAAAELSLRVGAILDDVEAEAVRIRAETRAEAERVLAAARAEADALVAQRRQRIAQLSDELTAGAEAVAARLEDAAPVRASFENLVRALGEAAERLAREIEAERMQAHGPAPFAGAPPSG